MLTSGVPLRPMWAGILVVGLAGGVGSAADLPFAAARSPVGARGLSGDGYRVPRWPVRPRPLRFDAEGYPVPGQVVVGAPDTLAVSGGCPVTLEPIYDAVGNIAGYAQFPNCR